MITWTNADLLSARLQQTDFNEISFAIHRFWFKKMHLNFSAKWFLSWPQCVNSMTRFREILWTVLSAVIHSIMEIRNYWYPGIILCMRPANERWRYTVMAYLIGWTHTQNDAGIPIETSKKTSFICSVGTVPADGLAPVGARTSAAQWWLECGTHIYTIPAL